MIPTSVFVVISLAALFLIPVSAFKKASFVTRPRRLTNLLSSPTRTPTPQKQKPVTSYEQSNVWKGLTTTAKEQVKRYFIHRATMVGIPWKEYYDLGVTNMDVLLKNFMEISDPSVVYPDYYTQAFHSYAEGNLNWEAALEVVAATISISASYWPSADMVSAQAWMRGNTTAAIQKHINDFEGKLTSIPKSTGRIMDIGCSVGASTKFLIEAFPEKEGVDAVDLSPYFLAAAKFYHTTTESPMFTALHDKISYHHVMAENLPFAEEAYDIISISFLLHEIPTKTSEEIIAEAYRVLRPGGTLAIVDLSGKRIRSLPQPRKHFFELTEPLVRQYYKTDPFKMMEDTGFQFVETKDNDPMNALWIGTKPVASSAIRQEQVVEAPLAITPLGMRLSAGASRLKSFIQNNQPEAASTPANGAALKSNEESFSVSKFLLNTLTDEHLWNVIRWGSSMYFAVLILLDLIHLMN